jgi:hypothetical protein
LGEPASRDEVAAVLVDFARARADGVLLLMVRRGEAAGWRAALPAADEARVNAFRLPLSQPSMVLALREGVPFYRGPMPPLKAHDAIAELLGELATGEILALPIRVRQRLVAVLIAASGSGPFPVAVLDDLKRVADKASMALELIVLRQKLHDA